MRISKFIVQGFIFLLFLLIFKGWLGTGILSAGDWPYLYPKAVDELVPLSSWDTLFNNGMGQSALPKIWFDSYALIIVKLANVLSWPVFERIIWFIPYLLISFFGAYFLSRKFGLSRDYGLLTGLIYSLNTYILLIVSGGQAGVFTAYAFLPITFSTFYNLLDNFSLRRSIIFSLSIAFLILLDLRVGYMFLIAEFLLGTIYLIFYRQKVLAKIGFMFVVPGIVALLLHLFWILPIILMGRNPASQLSGIYTSSLSLDFFSFAKMENTIGLLHPNWPENLFGKVAFLRPEFLIIPILAFASLLFAGKESNFKKISILSISLLGLAGIFLAKGTNDPFGEIYRTAFNIIPGYVMFRDPTKWYMLIAISFSILIPYSLSKISSIISSKRYLIPTISCFFILFWAFLIRDSFNGVLKGTLSPRSIPANYQNLAKFIESENNFSRTLWIPSYPPFAYVSNIHPAVPANDFFSATSSADLFEILKKNESEKLLRDAGIKYVIVPEDYDKKIFVSDRKYDERVYEKTLTGIKDIKYLSQIGEYGKIAIFEVKNPKGHFWGIRPGLKVSSKYISPTKYEVTVKDAKKGERIVFAETFDELWVARVGEYPARPASRNEAGVSSIQYPASKNQTLNSFKLPKDGSYTLEVYYKPQEWLHMGLVISAISLIAISGYLIFKKK